MTTTTRPVLEYVDDDIVRLYDDDSSANVAPRSSSYSSYVHDVRHQPPPMPRHLRSEAPETDDEDDDEQVPGGSTDLVPPSDSAFDEFRDQVNTWMEVDNSIKQLQGMLKDRREYKKRLTDKITQFMRRYDLTNLDMGSSGVIRSRRSHVKVPVSQKAVKEGITNYFERNNNVTLGMQLMDTVFNERERRERVSLIRSFAPTRKGN